MIKSSAYTVSYNKLQRILKRYNHLNSSLNKQGVFSDEFKRACIEKKYFEAYDVGINNLDYDFLLNDASFFQFSRSEKSGAVTLRYAYYPNPIDTISYIDYLTEHDFTFEECGEELKEQYEMDMSNASQKSDFNVIRYDYSEKEYSEGIHSVSHFHIGFKKSVSIPISKVLLPETFVNFILKSCFYTDWKEKISSDSVCKREYFSHKKSLKILKKRHWGELDKSELFIV